MVNPGYDYLLLLLQLYEVETHFILTLYMRKLILF